MNESEIVTRPATELDGEGFAQCMITTFEPYHSEFPPEVIRDTIAFAKDIQGRLANMQVVVAIEGDQVVGTISYLLRDDMGHIKGMAVLPTHQGLGIADKLLAAAENGLRGLGATRVTLDTTDAFQRAIRFYEKNGYQMTGKVADFHGTRLIEMAKDF